AAAAAANRRRRIRAAAGAARWLRRGRWRRPRPRRARRAAPSRAMLPMAAVVNADRRPRLPAVHVGARRHPLVAAALGGDDPDHESAAGKTRERERLEIAAAPADPAVPVHVADRAHDRRATAVAEAQLEPRGRW